MADPKHLPFELLDHIVSFLHNDIRSLKNLSNSCHVLDRISKPHLFAVLDFRRLSNPDLMPFRRSVMELHITWQMDMFNATEAELLERLLMPHLSPNVTPRLQSLVIRGIGSRGMEFLSTKGEALGCFTSLTNLTLWETHLPRFRDAQALVCALPYLKTLHVHTVSWNKDSGYDTPTTESLLQRPQLEALHVSPTFPEKTLVFLRWLAATPSQESLNTLDIPYAAHQAAALVPLFGPSVRSLVTPVRLLQASSVERYTALTSLTLLLHNHQPTVAHWNALPIVLSSLPSPALLCKLSLQLELKRMRSEEELSETVIHADILQTADRVLFPELEDGGLEGNMSGTPFEALRVVMFAVRTSLKLSRERRIAFEGVVRRLMPRTCARGNLHVAFEVGS